MTPHRPRARAPRTTGGLVQRPFGQVRNLYEPLRVLSDDQVAAIHQAALQVLAEIGMRVLHPPARALYQAAGAAVTGDQVRLDPGMVMDLLKTVPPSFTLEARNPLAEIAQSRGGVLHLWCSRRPGLCDGC